MDTLDFVKKIKEIEILKDFNFPDYGENKYAILDVPTRTFKDSDKNEITLGTFYQLFLGHMYKGEEKEFFYLNLYRKADKRLFRKHGFNPFEYNKIHVSGKTIDILIENLKTKLIGYQLT